MRHANGRDDIDFVIHGGDYTEFGVTKEFEWAVERLNQLRVPYVGLIGNHDILGNGQAERIINIRRRPSEMIAVIPLF